MNVGMNKILIADSEAAVSVFGVYYKMQTFVFMPVFGVTQAQSIIVGYNCGAQKPQRMRQVIKLALVSGIFIMFAGTAVVHLFPEKLLDLFSAGEDMMTIGAHALRVMTMPFCLSAICIICNLRVCLAYGYAYPIPETVAEKVTSRHEQPAK